MMLSAYLPESLVQTYILDHMTHMVLHLALQRFLITASGFMHSLYYNTTNGSMMREETTGIFVC